MMQEFVTNNPEGITLALRHWPVESPRAVMALVHGQGEHCGRYLHLARYFNEKNVAVMAIDLQGYGKSGGKRGHAARLDALLDDIEELLHTTRQHYPTLPVVLYGHSMGGGLTLNYTIRRKPDIRALVVTGPWIRLAFEAPAIKVLAGKLLRRFMPTLTLPTGLVANYISHDEAVVKAYQTDPLVHDKLSAAEGIALMEAAEYLDTYAGDMPVPTLIQHGGGDLITSAPASKDFAGRVRGSVTHREWPELYHEIHNEKNHLEVFDYTWAWLEGVI
jgi:alpha-beta hydrolase superfamily lysophospholipase